ncbi:MAG: peptidoglycan DD-metalloendopeptidase family protein [Endomicrobiia bacterium]
MRNKINIFITIIFSVIIFFNGKVQKTEEQIKKTQELIIQKTTVKNRCIQEEKNILKELKNLDVTIKKLDTEEKSLKQKISQIENKIKVLTNEIEILDTDIEFYRRFLSIELNRYVLDYVILTPFYENNIDRKIKKIAMRERYEQLQDVNNKKIFKVKISKEYNQQKEQLENYKMKLEQKRKQQKDLLIKKNGLLTQLKREKIKIEEEIQQLKNTQNSLEKVLKKLKEQELNRTVVKNRTIPEINKKFPYPVKGEIVSKFGKEKVENKDLSIIRNGIVIQTLGNSEVLSIDSGRVIFISNNFRSYGKMVIIEHSDEVYSVYGQLGEIFVTEGSKILKQQIIGRTNSVGQLYFELRKSLIPVNPEKYFE